MASIKPPNPIIDWGNPITKGLYLALPFTENSGTRLFELVNKIASTLVGTFSWKKGILGNTVLFDGSSSYVDVGTLGNFGSVVLPDRFSIHMVIKGTTATTQYSFLGTVNTGTTTLFQIQANTAANVNVSGKIQIQLRDNAGTKQLLASTTNDIGFNDGNVHHLTFNIYTATNTVEIYKDRISQAITYSNQESPVTFADFGFSLTFAARNVRGTIGQFLPYEIYHILVYKRLLLSNEVKQLYTDPWCIYQKPRFRFGYQTATTAIKDLISFGMIPFAR